MVCHSTTDIAFKRFRLFLGSSKLNPNYGEKKCKSGKMIAAEANTSESISVILKRYFVSLRQKQSQNRDITTITDDIKFMFTFVKDSLMHPVPVLKMMGAIYMKHCIAFNMSVFSQQIAMQPSKIKCLLIQEKWTDVSELQRNSLLKLVDKSEAKNYYIFEYPSDTDLGRFLESSPRLIATERTINIKDTSKLIVDNANTVLEARAAESVFPLVSIQYERDFASFTITDFDPNKKPPEKYTPKLTLQHIENYSMRTDTH